MGSTRSGSALLVMDAQESIASRVPGSDVTLGRMVAAIDRARRAGVPVLAGFTTSGVVLATALAAVDLDFEVTVLADACADHDHRVHELLLSSVLARRADVVPVDKWTLG